MDAAQAARTQVRIAREQWRANGYQLAHYYMLTSEAEIDLHTDSPEASAERLSKEWKPSALLRNIRHARAEMHWLRARLALSLAARRGARSLLRQVEADARVLMDLKRPWTTGLARLVLAGAASFESTAYAVILLDDAIEALESAGMALHVAAARYRKGELLGGAGGAFLMRDGRAAMKALGADNPDGFVRLLAPGFVHAKL
jgi:hypothetical protein